MALPSKTALSAKVLNLPCFSDGNSSVDWRLERLGWACKVVV
jgi:hypothetical protein